MSCRRETTPCCRSANTATFLSTGCACGRIADSERDDIVHGPDDGSETRAWVWRLRVLSHVPVDGHLRDLGPFAVGQLDLDRELDLAVGVEPLEQRVVGSGRVADAVIGPLASFR